MKKEDFYDLAAEMEKECGDWENSEGLSEKALKELLEKVEALDREETLREKSEKEKKVFRLKKRYILVLAAALVLLFGLGVNGDRAWIAKSRDLERETEVTTKVNTEDKESVLREEEAIYQEIGETLGIVPMRIGYKPDGMVLDSYSIAETTGWAYLNYLYDGKLVSVQMAKESDEASGNLQWDGEAKELDVSFSKYKMEAYCIDQEHGNYQANISYGNGFYSIAGFFSSEEEFFAILEKIYFKNL